MLQLHRREIAAGTLACAAADVAWDRFESTAHDARVSKKLVTLGWTISGKPTRKTGQSTSTSNGRLDGRARLIHPALAFPEDCTARCQQLLDSGGTPRDVEVPPVTTDSWDVTDGLQVLGIQTSFIC